MTSKKGKQQNKSKSSEFKNTSTSPSSEDTDVSDDEHEIMNETIMDRVRALSEIFPEHSRESLKKSIVSASTTALSLAKMVGNVAWILTTSAMVLFVPLMFEMEKEQALVAFEQEQQMQQRALQPVGLPAPPTGSAAVGGSGASKK